MAGRVGAIDVVSLNICLGTTNRLPPIRDRAAEFCRRLEASDTRLLLLQEVWSAAVARFLRARLPSFPHVAARRGPTGGPAGGLLTFSRRPLGPASFASFRGAGPVGGSVGFRARRRLSGRLKGVLTTTAGGFTVLNTQLSANRDGDWSPANRHYGLHRGQLAALQAAARGTKRILGGDFNVAAGSPLYPLIMESGWHDAFAADDVPTFRAEYLPAGRRPHRIDYLLVAGAPVLAADHLFAEPGAALSDHLALRLRL